MFNRTCENSSTFPLILRTTSCFAILSKWRFEHEAGYVVSLLELGLSHFQFCLLEVWYDMCYLNIRYFRIQFAYVDRYRIHYYLNVLRSVLFAIQTQ